MIIDIRAVQTDTEGSVVKVEVDRPPTAESQMDFMLIASFLTDIIISVLNMGQTH